MPALQASEIQDLVYNTLNELGRGKFTEITTDFQRHIAIPKLINKKKVQFDDGVEIQFNVMTNHNESAEMTGLFNVDNVNVNEVMTQGKVPWRHCQASWAIDEREVMINRSPSKIVDMIKTRRIACLISLAQLMERRFWRVPASTDDTNFYGVPYWIVKSATATSTNNGFNGTVPSGYSTVGNLSPTTYPRWANYAAPYTNITKSDLIREWRRAAHMTDWTPPVEGVPEFDTGDGFGFYTTYSLFSQLIEILEAQNESLGGDIAPYDGRGVVFMGTDVMWVPALSNGNDNDTTNPVYGIYWGEFKPFVMTGRWMKDTAIAKTPGQHNVSSYFVDCSMNFVCRNRRRCFVVSNGTTLPA